MPSFMVWKNKDTQILLVKMKIEQSLWETALYSQVEHAHPMTHPFQGWAQTPQQQFSNFGLRLPFPLLQLTEDPKELSRLYGFYLLVVTVLGVKMEKNFTHEDTQALILPAVRAMMSSHAL